MGASRCARGFSMRCFKCCWSSRQREFGRWRVGVSSRDSCWLLALAEFWEVVWIVGLGREDAREVEEVLRRSFCVPSVTMSSGLIFLVIPVALS